MKRGQMYERTAVALGDMMRLIKREIQGVHDEAIQDDNALMQFVECEFEFAVEVETVVKGDAKAEFKLYVVNVGLGAGAQRTQTATNKVKLKYAALPDVQLVAAVESLDRELPKPVKKSRKIQGGTQ